MYSYAQTNIQLFNQLRESDYAQADLTSVRDAYAVTMRLFTGCFRQTGKTFIAHLVGTASILANVHAKAPMVAAGLLHSAYSHGEFGTGKRGISDTKRKQLRLAVGIDVEHLIARYTDFPWNKEAISALQHNPPSPGSVEREVLLIRLANELEDHLDLAALYSGNTEHRQSVIKSYMYQCVDIAEKLGYPDLSSGLAKAFKETLSTELPSTLKEENINLTHKKTVYLIGWKSSFLFPPETHGLRLGVRLRRTSPRHLLMRAARFALPR